MMEECVLCLDVGGTEIKAAALAADGSLRQAISHFPAMADRPAPVILSHLATILRTVQPVDASVGGVRLAFPGPFDYANGICLLQGLAKFDALYGVSLRRELSRRLDLPPEKFAFANDADAFALGEMAYGPAHGAARCLFICIGTGCGSAFGVGGALARGGAPGVPDSGYLYDTPFLDGCIDDYLSRRGLLSLSATRLGEALDGKALAGRARQGDTGAAACLLAFGERVRDALTPFLDSFRPQTVCFGGQISKSGDLFLPPLQIACQRRGIRLYTTQDTSLRTLQGLSCL